MLDVDEHPSNQRPEVEHMDMMDMDIVEVEGMDMVEEQPSKQQLEVEGMDMMEEHPSKQRSKVEGIDMVRMDMVEDTMVEVVEREHETVVMAKHLIDDGAERHRQIHQERELAKSRC
jgi:hypothetical protein